MSLAAAAVRFAVLGLLVAGVGCGEHGGSDIGAVGATDAPPPEEAVPVKTVAAATQAVPRGVSCVGTLMPAEEVLLSAKVEGRLAEVAVRVSDRVAPGQTVARLEPADADLAVRQAEEAVAEAAEVLGLPELAAPTAPPLPPESIDGLVAKSPAVRRAQALVTQARAEADAAAGAVEAARARLAGAEADAANADDKLERSRRLHESRVVGDQELQDAVTRRDTARSARDSAAAELRAAQARVAVAAAARGSAEAVVETTVLEIRARIATLRRLRVALDIARKTRLDADTVAPPLPADLGPAAKMWTVSEKHASAGEHRAVGTPLMRLVADDVIQLVASVAERHIADVKLGLPVEVRTDAGGGTVVAGRVHRIRPVADAAARQFDVEIRVDNPDGVLRPGMFARAVIRTRTDPAVVTVPEDAVVSFAGIDKVFTVADGRARVKPVRLGARLPGGRVEIAEGLAAGTRVVISGQRLLAEGVPVREGSRE
jgi:RND family efflux transporter MFP subunit